ncbi:hypothetical protein CDL12_26612 [Handroanthus impetiginosus]|uniref:Small ribosomal subunit protein bS20c n=1 Tax=Handroanthus impetiginosus TaxID=429701 RepID=A0A2G9G6G0_9LAMI|nr:hypothetical protein CDL12_26612 [Handroanthus impetiginosus]
MAHCVSCWGLAAKFNSLSLKNNPSAAFKPLSFSSSISTLNLFPRGLVSPRQMHMSPRRLSIVCEVGSKKADSAAKRARQAEKRRLYHKARKSEIRTRMKKVMEALEVLQKKSDAKPEEVLPIEKLIAEAYSVIDKAVKVGTLHQNTGARRKSRLARRIKAVQIHHGWYTPPPAPTPVRLSIVCEVGSKKADSAAKRARQAEKRRLYHKARKSEIRTRMKKVMEALEVLQKKSVAKPEEVLPIEKLIAEAYSVIDKAVKVGTLHQNTGARRKSRLARRIKAVQIHHGWYTPPPAPTPAPAPAPTA